MTTWKSKAAKSPGRRPPAYTRYLREIQTLFVDDDIVVMFKPASILIQSDITGDPNLLDFCKQMLREKHGGKRHVFIGLVHRLDRPASGLVVFGRTPVAASHLSRQFRERRVSKRYFAVVHGKPPVHARCEDILVKDRKMKKVQAVSPNENTGKKALMTFHRIGTMHGRSLLDLRLITGRSHQIRVQLASRGFPIIGDRKYGSREVLRNPGMIALWAYQLTIVHPSHGKEMTFHSPRPSHWPWHSSKF